MKIELGMKLVCATRPWGALLRDAVSWWMPWVLGLAVFVPMSLRAEPEALKWDDGRWALVLRKTSAPGEPAKMSLKDAEGRGLLEFSGTNRETLTLKPADAAFSLVWADKLALPCRMTCDFSRIWGDVAVVSKGVPVVSLYARKHWAKELGLMTVFYTHLKTRTSLTPPPDYNYRSWWHATVEVQKDYSKVTVTERDSGRLLLDYGRVPHDAVGEMDLQVSTVNTNRSPPFMVRNVSLEPIPPDAAVAAAPKPPPNHQLLFHDDFSGPATNWGSDRVLPGVLTLKLRNYFSFSYPVYVPGLALADGVIETSVMFTAAGQAEVRFRIDPHGDKYYAFRVGTQIPGEFLKSSDIGAPAKPIGKVLHPRQRALKCEVGKWHAIRIEADGPSLRASIDGEDAATARDADHASGAVALGGSAESSTLFRSFTVFRKGNAGGEWTPASAPSPAKPAPAEPPSAPRADVASLPRQPMDGAGTVRDANKAVHHYRLKEGVLLYDGLPYIPVRDSDGQYFVLYEPERWPREAWDSLRSDTTLQDLSRHGLTGPIVRLRLADYIDCRNTDHKFHEDGGIGGRSRILQIGKVPYRVTEARKVLPPYFVYTSTFDATNRAHVIAYEVPNDRERYLSVDPIPSESGSGGVYTGGNFPVDGDSHVQMHVYYPTKREIEWVFMQPVVGVNKIMKWSPESGAAVSKFWAMELMDPPGDTRPVVHAPRGPSRNIGTHEQHNTYIFRNYGVLMDRAHPSAEQRRASFANWLDYVRFAGGNLAVVHWLGTDCMLDANYTSNVLYPSKLFAEWRKKDTDDCVQELLPEVEARGMVTYASLPSYNFTDENKQKLGLTDDDFLVNKEGAQARIFDRAKLDPTSERVKQLFVKIVDELASVVAPSKSVEGVGIWIDGFFTLGDALGYGPNTLKRYQHDTGAVLPSPSDAAASFDWLHATPERLKSWQAWRCAQMHDLLIRLRDAVRARRPDMILKVAVVNTRTQKFLRSTDAEALDLLLGQGIDPALYRNEEGLVFAQRSFYEGKVLNREGTEGFNFTHGVADIPTRYGTSYHQWTGYWEQAGAFNSLSRYNIGWLASASLVPVGRRILETATYHLRVGNIRELEYQTWERGTSGWEQYLRRFAAAYRSLPVAEPKPFDGKVETVSGPPRDETLALRWFQDRLAVINDRAEGRVIRLQAKELFPQSPAVAELGRSRRLDAIGGTVELELLPYDLLVLAPASELGDSEK